MLHHLRFAATTSKASTQWQKKQVEKSRWSTAGNTKTGNFSQQTHETRELNIQISDVCNDFY